MLQRFEVKQYFQQRDRWVKKLIAILALINLGLVFFNLTYISLRDFYWQTLPAIVRSYDVVKGIEPHPETQYYLNKVDDFQAQALQVGLNSPNTESLLNELRILSVRLIEDNPFEEAGKSSALAKIKNEMLLHTQQKSAREAFATFWSLDYLARNDWRSQLDFFTTKIRHLINSNYYRDVSQFGHFIDRFWLIDLPFVAIFAVEYLYHTFYISRLNSNLSWLEAILRRWYNLLLLLPFWRWLRVIPVTLRLSQADLLNLKPLRNQFNRDFLLIFAGNFLKVISAQAIGKMQNTIRRGDFSRWLFNRDARSSYIHITDDNETQSIATRVFDISVYEVLPKVQPDIEALVRHNLENTLSESPLFHQMRKLPGFEHLSDRIAQNLTKDLYRRIYGGLKDSFEDPVSAKLTKNLFENFKNNLQQELQKEYNWEEIQTWLTDVLEEIKINYVKNLTDDEVEKLVDELERMQYSPLTS
jgi:hypothetical protein